MGCASSTASTSYTTAKSGATSKPACLQEQSLRPLKDSYNLGRCIGAGASGMVYTCFSKQDDNNEYAVKLLHLGENNKAQILREASNLKSLNHPHIVKCCDVVYDEPCIGIIMQKAGCSNLERGIDDYFDKHGSGLPCLSALELAKQIAGAMQYLHEHHIAHRDIKADNCAYHGDLCSGAHTTLTDFGSATACKPGWRLHEACGTVLYWAPEFHALDYTLKVDIWAFGVLVFWLLHGMLPFRSAGGCYRSPIEAPHDASRDCHRFLQSVLQKDEHQRANATQVVQHAWMTAEVKYDTMESQIITTGNKKIMLL